MEVKFNLYDLAEKAHEAALKEQAATYKRMMLGILFKQGGVWMMSSAILFKDIPGLTFSDPIDRDGDFTNGTNRPRVPKHAEEIGTYLSTTEQYICPALTLNLMSVPRIFTTDSDTSYRQAWVLLPEEFQFQIVDGQHRTSVIPDVLLVRPEMANDGVALHIIFENDPKRIHQYFADCSKSLPISASLTQYWDQNYILNELSKDVCLAVPLFHNLEINNKQVTSLSTKTFTVSGVNAALTECITFRAEEKTKTVANALARAFADFGPAQLTEDVKFIFETFAQKNTQWRDYGEGKSQKTVPQLRAQYLHFNRLGLRLLGRIGFTVLRTVEGRDQQAEIIAKFAAMDFDKRAEFWRKNNITLGNGSMAAGSNAPIRLATEVVEEYLGIGGLRKAYEDQTGASERAERERQKKNLKVAEAVEQAQISAPSQKILDRLLKQNKPRRRPPPRSGQM